MLFLGWKFKGSGWTQPSLRSLGGLSRGPSEALFCFKASNTFSYNRQVPAKVPAKRENTCFKHFPSPSVSPQAYA